MRIALYIRVSTTEQNSALQRADLDKYIQERGLECTGIYEDVMSGARQSRPGLNRLLADAADGKFDVVAVWKLDRFGRSLVDCLKNIETSVLLLQPSGSVALRSGAVSELRQPAGSAALRHKKSPRGTKTNPKVRADEPYVEP
jgi:hypothetical protein